MAGSDREQRPLVTPRHFMQTSWYICVCMCGECVVNVCVCVLVCVYVHAYTLKRTAYHFPTFDHRERCGQSSGPSELSLSSKSNLGVHTHTHTHIRAHISIGVHAHTYTSTDAQKKTHTMQKYLLDDLSGRSNLEAYTYPH